EDGIRDFHVTGVQTCALPILPRQHRRLVVVGQDDAQHSITSTAYCPSLTPATHLIRYSRRPVGSRSGSPLMLNTRPSQRILHEDLMPPGNHGTRMRAAMSDCIWPDCRNSRPGPVSTSAGTSASSVSESGQTVCQLTCSTPSLSRSVTCAWNVTAWIRCWLKVVIRPDAAGKGAA